MMAPAPAPVQIGETSAMVARVDSAHQRAQTTPQLSFGADGMTVQQPVVSRHDGHSMLYAQPSTLHAACTTLTTPHAACPTVDSKPCLLDAQRSRKLREFADTSMQAQSMLPGGL